MLALAHRLVHRGPAGRLSRPELALVTWLVAYPLITILLATAGPVLAELPLMLRTLVITAVLIPTLSVLVPVLSARLGRLEARR